MKCKFCGSNVPGGEIRCEVCGFTHVNFTDGDSSGALEKMIEKYKKSKLGDISIDLISHRYVIENGEFKDYHTESVKIADAVELVPDKIVWLKKSFYGSESDKTIVVEVCVGKNEKAHRRAPVRQTPAAQRSVRSSAIRVPRDLSLDRAAALRNTA